MTQPQGGILRPVAREAEGPVRARAPEPQHRRGFVFADRCSNDPLMLDPWTFQISDRAAFRRLVQRPSRNDTLEFFNNFRMMLTKITTLLLIADELSYVARSNGEIQDVIAISCLDGPEVLLQRFHRAFQAGYLICCDAASFFRP